MKGIESTNWEGLVALVRCDLNVPLSDDQSVIDDSKIVRSLPTIKHVLEHGGGCVILSHLGRPKEGAPDPRLSLKPVYERMADSLGHDRTNFADELGSASRPRCGEVLVLENTRFNLGEKSCDQDLCAQYAKLGDAFVFDAFASAHRTEASTVGVARCFTNRMGGRLLMEEVDRLGKILGGDLPGPLVAVTGGAKVSTKLGLIRNLLKKTSSIILGGGIANTFLAAGDASLGKSLVEPAMFEEARSMMKEFGTKISLPLDGVCAKSPDCTDTRIVDTGRGGTLDEEEMLLDIGPRSIEEFIRTISVAGTILWNGPLGLFEKNQFSRGTKEVGQAIAKLRVPSVAGGGETISAINKFGIKGISHVSTGGGAMLEFLEGKTLPGIEALQGAACNA